MHQNPITTVAAEAGLSEAQVQAVADLLAEDASIPFIARYRKEATGSLDEVAVTTIRDRLKQIDALQRRREAILKSLDKQGKRTPALEAAIMETGELAVLEDIYLPYRPKRRTRAIKAKEKGLEPLAEKIYAQQGNDPVQLAAGFIDSEKGVDTVEQALAGAADIMAEWISEDARARARLRRLFSEKGMIQSTVARDQEAGGAKYRDYFNWREPVATVPSHRMLAMRRGEKEDILNLTIAPDAKRAVAMLEEMCVCGDGPDARQVALAAADSYKRLLSRSLETEIRIECKEKADAVAIGVFAANLRELLMAPPLGAKRVMGIDPGFRTGCKLACVDRQGKLLQHATVNPHTSEKKRMEAAQKIRELCAMFSIEAVAVGNGTAGRETEAFVRELAPESVHIVMVSESGASIYSASDTARQEFPDLDLTFRGAVSIARRLMDPLSELVKIDPKSIGVGQYQHDVDQDALKQALDDIVTSCVNAVGVDVNRASAALLTYVSGLGPRLAQNIVSHRDAHGAFRTREELKNVPRLGPKAFEQAAGFLRIDGGDNPLDASAVHPESYRVVAAMAADLGCRVADLMTDATLRQRIDIARYVRDTVGLPTLRDIVAELAKPGRDPRQRFEPFAFADDVREIGDLKPGMRLPGIVTNVTAFGAFVDVGVHQDGLVHISELADRFVKDPGTVVRVGQKVSVAVLTVEPERKRIALSMKSGGGARENPPRRRAPGKQTLPKRKNPRTPFNNPFIELLQDRKQ